MSSLLLKLLINTPLLAALLGPVVMLVVDYCKKFWTWLDAQSAFVKQAFALVLSFVLVALTHLIPGIVPPDCANILANGISSSCEAALTSSTFLTTILTTLVAIALKHGQQNSSSNAAAAK